jgi:hypothetical protein
MSKWTMGEISDTDEATVLELTRVDDHASDGGAVTTDPLGRTVYDNICTVVNGTDQVPYRMQSSEVISPRRG